MKLLVVSFGNICRGPMAAGLARKIAVEKELVLQVETAGTAAHHGAVVAPLAADAMMQVGVDIWQHRSKPVTAGFLEWTDVVVAVEADLALALRLQHPDLAGKILALESDVPDPRRLGAVLRDYVHCRDLLDRLLRRLPVYTAPSPSSGAPACPFTSGGRVASSRRKVSCRTAAP